MYEFFKIKRTENLNKGIENDGFYESYFEVFNLLKDEKKTPFNENSLCKQTNYFGAFINYFKLESEENVKCGIPNLIFKTDNKELDKFKKIHEFYSSSYDEMNQDEIKQDEIVIDKKVKRVDEKLNNYEMLWFDFSLNFDDIYHKTAENKCTLTHKIFENHPSKRKYISLIEENLLLTPFNILNYDIALQKNVDNLVFQLKEFITANKMWKNIFSLIQGIPSELFIYDERNFLFTQIDKEIRMVGCLPKFTENVLKFFIDFGSKIRIIQSVVHYFLYTCENCPLTLRNFFYFIDELIISIIQNIIKIKQMNKKQIVFLYQEVQTSFKTLNFIYYILDLSEATKVYLKLNINNQFNLNSFIIYYSGNYLKSNKIADTLIKFYESTKNNMYYYTRTMLIYVLKAYLFYIFELIFNSENNDISNEFFIEKISEKWYFKLKTEQCPNFLKKYQRLILNITIYSMIIKKFNSDYFAIINIHCNDLKSFILNMEDNIFFSDYIKKFKSLKQEIFNKKIMFLYKLNDKFKEVILINENNKKLEKIEKLKAQKVYRELLRKQEKTEFTEKIDKQRNFFFEVKKDLQQKQKRKDMEIQMIKEETLLNKKQEEIKKKIEEEIIESMKRKYQRYLNGIYESEEKSNWKRKRTEINIKRNKEFEKLFDYSNYSLNKLDQQFSYDDNYHFKMEEDIKMIEESYEISYLEKESHTNLLTERNNNIVTEELEIITNYVKKTLLEDILNIVMKNYKVPMKKELVPIFKDYDIDNEVLHKMKKIKGLFDDNDITVNILDDLPINFIIKEFFYDALIKQYKIVNKCFIDMLTHIYEIRNYYEILYQYFLCVNGDIISEFIESILNFSTLQLLYNDEEFLNENLRMVITKQKSYLSEKELLLHFKKLSNVQIFKLNIKHFSSSYYLHFQVDEPVDFLLRNDSMILFNQIFQNLFKIKVIECLFSQAYANFKSNNITSNKYQQFTKKFNYFSVIIKTIHKYIFDLILIKWNNFKSQLNETVDVEEYLENQQEFLTSCLKLFDDNEKKIVFILNKIHKKICKLHLQLVNFSEDLINIKENENLILIIMERINNQMKVLTKIIFDGKSNGDFFKLKDYLNVNQIY